MGWDIDRFPEGEVNLELICCICTCILEDPVESPCRHVFCSSCIKTWLSNQKTCPSCRAPVHKKDLQSVVPLLRNIISKQRIFCDNKDKGCSELVALEMLPSHIASCSYGLAHCVNDGCNVKVMRKDLKNHGEICLKRTVMCENGCEMFLTLGEKNSHNCTRALKIHFQETTNELLSRISKLEELVNVLMSKNSSSSPSLTTIAPRCSIPSVTYDDVSDGGGGGVNSSVQILSSGPVATTYAIPSPRHYSSNAHRYVEQGNGGTINLDTPISLSSYSNRVGENPADFSDSLESVDSSLQDADEHHSSVMPEASMSPVYDATPTVSMRVPRPEVRPRDPPLSTSSVSSTTVGPAHQPRVRQRGGTSLQPQPRTTTHHRTRSRSPYGGWSRRDLRVDRPARAPVNADRDHINPRQHSHVSSVAPLYPPPETPVMSIVPPTGTATGADAARNTGSGDAEPLVLRIGVSSHTVSDSSSSTTTSSSESESD